MLHLFRNVLSERLCRPFVHSRYFWHFRRGQTQLQSTHREVGVLLPWLPRNVYGSVCSRTSTVYYRWKHRNYTSFSTWIFSAVTQTKICLNTDCPVSVPLEWQWTAGWPKPIVFLSFLRAIYSPSEYTFIYILNRYTWNMLKWFFNPSSDQNHTSGRGRLYTVYVYNADLGNVYC